MGAGKSDTFTSHPYMGHVAFLITWAPKGPGLTVRRDPAEARERPDGLATGMTVGPFIQLLGLIGYIRHYIWPPGWHYLYLLRSSK